jgi:hypothetical protein
LVKEWVIGPQKQLLENKLMSQYYQITTVDTLLKWILLMLNNNYTIEKNEGEIWLYDQNGEGVEYIDDPMENN